LFDSKKLTKREQEFKSLELTEYKEELKKESVADLIDWEESVRLYQRQMLFSKKKFANKHIFCRNHLRRVRANLWSGQRKRQGVEV